MLHKRCMHNGFNSLIAIKPWKYLPIGAFTTDCVAIVAQKEQKMKDVYSLTVFWYPSSSLSLNLFVFKSYRWSQTTIILLAVRILNLDKNDSCHYISVGSVVLLVRVCECNFLKGLSKSLNSWMVTGENEALQPIAIVLVRWQQIQLVLVLASTQFSTQCGCL